MAGREEARRAKIAIARQKRDWHLGLAEKYARIAEKYERALAGPVFRAGARLKINGQVSGYGQINRDRNRAIAEAREAGESLEEIATRYGVSRQRIEQIVRRYDAQHGTTVAATGKQRAKATRPPRHNVPRVAKVCEGCGGTWTGTPSAVKGRRFCSMACSARAMFGKITDDDLWGVIEDRYAGLTWSEILRTRFVYRISAPNVVQRALVSYLHRHDLFRPEIVNPLFSTQRQGSPPPWIYRIAPVKGPKASQAHGG